MDPLTDDGKSREQQLLQLSRFCEALWLKRQMTDVEVHVEAEVFQAHKLILTCHSPYFHKLLISTKPEMLKPFPEKPWSRLHVDYAGPYRNTYFFIPVDAFSKWIEVFPVSTPSAEATISCRRIMFANQGLPDVVVSDNGPAFTRELYSTFLKKNGVMRMLVPPYHPASNGAAERAV
ncbi:hypothetical protein MTO96_024362 [Rhipicephalus appendiculatus]